MVPLPVIGWFDSLSVFQDPSLEYGKRNSRSSMFRIVPKFKKEKVLKKGTSQPGKYPPT